MPAGTGMTGLGNKTRQDAAHRAQRPTPLPDGRGSLGSLGQPLPDGRGSLWNPYPIPHGRGSLWNPYPIPHGRGSLRGKCVRLSGGSWRGDGLDCGWLDGAMARYPASPIGREVVECQQRLAVSGQAVGRVRVLRFIGGEEEVQGPVRLRLRRRHPDVVEHCLGVRLDALGQLVEHVGGLVNPAALATRRREHLGQRFPEAQCSIAGRESGLDRQAAMPDLQQQRLP